MFGVAFRAQVKGSLLARKQITDSEMKFFQTAVVLALLVVSTYAIQCNVGGSALCNKAQDFPTYDSCYSCTVSAGGASAISAGSCNSVAGITNTCDATKAACSSGYKACQTNNCNSCSPASALQASVVFLLAAAAAILL